jgi:S1-C subfamily serine protease
VPSNSVTQFLRRGAEGMGLGVVVRPVREGVLVLEVEPGSPAARPSLMIGDLLIGANGRRFESIEDLGEAIRASQGGTLRLQFLRGDRAVRREASVHLEVERAEAA